ncbi:precorrin-3B C17-methyltransferase [Candidatus Methanophagaceae archaeon]|nr:precorrin-3B C17-methyltransferase [Methanophagales archaeon]
MLSVVGIGPGSLDLLTERARTRISRADVIMGNERYIELIKEILPTNAELIIGKMGTEVERAKKAVELGNRKNVVIVSGGDPGIYGMAGLTLEVISDSDIGVEIVPGITAASAAAALLGAPLSNDFAVVSLSDLLVPWPEIEKRLEGLAIMGIAVVIYNPKSKTRTTQLERAHEIFMRFRDGKTLVGIVKNAEREGSEVLITTLESFTTFYPQIDMSTTIIIGSSGTKNIGGRMVTRRGYENKYDYVRVEETVNQSHERGDSVAAGARVWEQSKAIVADIVSKYPLSEHERRVAGRVVFANADPSFMDLIVFKHNPIKKGIQSIQDGKTIITDIEMVKAGISKRYKENVKCFVNNPKTREIAVKENLTRTAAGFRIAKELIRDNIVVIGNAPSTCLELSALLEEGIKPALIIATPVGFVNAADVKEDVLSTGIPCIVIRGPRGGTPSAVAIINAIIELSMEEEQGGN